MLALRAGGKTALLQKPFVAAFERLGIQRDAQTRPRGHRHDTLLRTERPAFDDVVGIPAHDGLTGFANMFQGGGELKISGGADACFARMESERHVEMLARPDEIDRS